jgi:hypothetical protein
MRLKINIHTCNVLTAKICEWRLCWLIYIGYTIDKIARKLYSYPLQSDLPLVLIFISLQTA